MLADEVDFVIGVDTHRDAHALAVVAAATDGVVPTRGRAWESAARQDERVRRSVAAKENR